MSNNLFKGFKTSKDERKVLLKYFNGSLVEDVSMVLLERESARMYSLIRSFVIVASGWFAGRLLASFII
ncbi:MAG: hypothetical protein ACRC92_26290 [Peptostreptococcaceae bacterium]